jgi:hypothetical protein
LEAKRSRNQVPDFDALRHRSVVCFSLVAAPKKPMNISQKSKTTVSWNGGGVEQEF